MNIICIKNVIVFSIWAAVHIPVSYVLLRPGEMEILQLNNIGHNLFLPKFI